MESSKHSRATVWGRNAVRRSFLSVAKFLFTPRKGKIAHHLQPFPHLPTSPGLGAGEREARDLRDVSTAELPKPSTTPLPVRGRELGHGGEYLDDAAHGVATVQSRSGSADDFESLDIIGINKREVLIWRRAE